MSKKSVFFLGLLTLFQLAGAQNPEFRILSYSDFFELIQTTKDHKFELNDAIVQYNPETDSTHFHTEDQAKVHEMRTSYITIDKFISLNNVHFDVGNGRSGRALHRIHFKDRINLMHTGSVFFNECRFDSLPLIFTEEPAKQGINWFRENRNVHRSAIILEGCEFNQSVDIIIQSFSQRLDLSLVVNNCTVKVGDRNRMKYMSLTSIGCLQSLISNNTFLGYQSLTYHISGNDYVNILGNKLDRGNVDVILQELPLTSNINILNNDWPDLVFLDTDELNSNANLGWDQWNGRIHSFQAYIDSRNWSGYETISPNQIDSMQRIYAERLIYENEFYFNEEIKLYGRLLDLYDSQHNSKSANGAFIQIKELETKRQKFLYEQNPSFDGFFQWKINSFLKIFSDYGTKPSKAIVFSIYVILLFALFYLFTPNSWDTLNRNRLIRRIRFFTKYFRRDEGIREVFEEEKKESVMNYEEFREYMNESKREIPGYFILAAMPLYYFALANYKTTVRILGRLDILKGKWVALPPKRKIGTSIIMAFWLLLMIMFDIAIKILNAVILSINTFTTLGFGEIPIKGIARYLAIIQGFIGWFMLSLFSVSLISQLMH